MPRTRFAGIVLALFLLVTIQPAGSDCPQYPAPLEKGSQSLLFGISSYYTLTSFDGGFIGYQRFLADGLALRFNFGGWYTERDLDGTQIYGEQPDHPLDTVRNSWTRRGTASIDLVKHISQGRTTVFFGGGSRFEIDNYRRIDDWDYQSGQSGDYAMRRTYEEDSQYLVGLTYVFGMQWRLHGRFFLNAEYAGSFSIGRGKTVRETIYEDDPEEYELAEREGAVREFKNLGVRFGLTAFF